MSDDGERFLARWSRRKRSEEEPGRASESQEDAAPPAAPGGDATPESAVETGGDPEVVARLPDIETLEESSDFTVFMAEGVPEALRRRALRKLWRLDPVFANLDGLNDYDEDFTDAATVIEGMKTIYKVGRGMLDDTPEAEPEADAEGGTEPAEEVPSDETIPEEEMPEVETPAEEIAEAAPAEVVLASDEPERSDQEARRARIRDSGRSAVQRRWGIADG